MKRILLLMIFLIGVSYAEVEAVPNPCCGGIDTGPCTWWTPEGCAAPTPPPVVPDAKKQLAKAKRDYYDSAAYGFNLIMGGTCPWLPYTKWVCGSATFMWANALQFSKDQQKIVTDPWDPDYWQPYDAPWPSAESLGLWYTDSGTLNNLLWYSQAIAQAADFIYVSANRASSCAMANEQDCFDWQSQRVNDGLWWLGYWMNEWGNEAWWLAWESENNGEYQNPYFVDMVRDAAWQANDAGWRYQQ